MKIETGITFVNNILLFSGRCCKNYCLWFQKNRQTILKWLMLSVPHQNLCLLYHDSGQIVNFQLFTKTEIGEQYNQWTYKLEYFKKKMRSSITSKKCAKYWQIESQIKIRINSVHQDFEKIRWKKNKKTASKKSVYDSFLCMLSLISPISMSLKST